MINLILSETNRSYLYIREILKKNLIIKSIILYTNKPGPTYKLIKKNKLKNKCFVLNTQNVNSNKIINNFLPKKNETNIISTYPGEIIKNNKLLKFKLLHCHPGNLPEFKGSTTIYYNLIVKNKIYVTIFIITDKIDTGKILYKKYFNKPYKINEIEKNYDDLIRSKTLVEFLSKKRVKKYTSSKKKFLPYYIAHPIIRSLVLNKNILRLVNNHNQ